MTAHMSNPAYLDSEYTVGILCIFMFVCRSVIHIPEEPHLLVFLLVIPDDLGGGHAHLYAVDNKPPGSLQSFTREVLRCRQRVAEKGRRWMKSDLKYETNLRLHLCACITTCV